jgi:hypothetical protein
LIEKSKSQRQCSSLLKANKQAMLPLRLLDTSGTSGK